MNKLFVLLLCVLCQPVFAQSLRIENPRIEYRRNPLGIAKTHPRFSWEMGTNHGDVLQEWYQILVSDNLAGLQKNEGNQWDSKWVRSDSSLLIAYQGKTLVSAKRYYWKVRVRDTHGHTSNWSAAQHWQMGLLNASDWKGAHWIGYEVLADSSRIAPHAHLNGKKAWGPRRNVLPLFRKEFQVKGRIKQATIFICGLGHFELTMNGQKAGQDVLAPGWTNYSQLANYVTYDVSSLLKTGNNAIGVQLGNGFYYIPSQRYRKMTGAYGYPKLIARLVIDYADGSTTELVSGQDWKTAPSPVFFSSIYGGEDYDASLVQQGWNRAGFDDRSWRAAVLAQGPPVLEPQVEEPVKIMEQLPTKQRFTTSRGSRIYDLGQNFSGFPAIRVKGNKGDTVRLYCGELLHSDSSINQKATGSPSYFSYVLSGAGQESWQPRFSYTGFRYVEAFCIPARQGSAAPQILELTGMHIRNAADSAGSFQSSNNLFNKTHTLINWAIKSNMLSVFTDCPHREKLGWLEQTQLMGASVHFNYDVAALNRKVVSDMQHAQYADGRIPEIAPEFVQFTPPFDESPEWGSASIILPWYQYLWYGDRPQLEAAWPMMKGYLGYLKGKAKNHILTHGLGDWYDIGPNKSGFAQMTRMGITATATYYYDLQIMEKAANLLGYPQEAEQYQQLARAVRTAFNTEFFDQQRLQYDSASQTANAMALYMGLVEDRHRQAVLDALIRDIRNRNNALTAGDIGYRYVLKALEQAGRNEVIYDMNCRDDVPGYGFQIRHGATALTESWQAYESVSNNHFMLGHLMEWLYSGLAGIQQSSESVAYKHLVIQPAFVGDLQQVSARFHSPYGWVGSSWTKTPDQVKLHLELPANTKATLVLPFTKTGVYLQDGKQLKGKQQGDKIQFELGSGVKEILWQKN